VHHDDESTPRLEHPVVAGLLVSPIARLSSWRIGSRPSFPAMVTVWSVLASVDEHDLVDDVWVKFDYCGVIAVAAAL